MGLCRMHGATKPLVAAAFLTLVDAGKCRLADPVSKYIRFPNRVLSSSSGSSNARSGARKRTKKDAGIALQKGDPVARLGDLLTMTAGLGYEDSPSYKPLRKRLATG